MLLTGRPGERALVLVTGRKGGGGSKGEVFLRENQVQVWPCPRVNGSTVPSVMEKVKRFFFFFLGGGAGTAHYYYFFPLCILAEGKGCKVPLGTHGWALRAAKLLYPCVSHSAQASRGLFLQQQIKRGSSA